MESPSYQPVNGDVDVYDINEDRKIPNSQGAIYRAVLVGVAIGAVLSFLALRIIPMEPKDKCTRKMSAWSPALEIYNDDEFSMQRFFGSLREPSRFSGPPNKSIDDAWEEITYPKGALLRISRDQLEKVNGSDFAAEYTEKMGGGYMAGLAVFHQLHCVNMLRQATYMDYYLPKKPEWREDMVTLRVHLDHCINMLRQKLMCDPDVGMTTYAWVKGWKQPFPDFNNVHKCRPYSKILDWAQENYVHEGNISDIKRAPGALELDARP